MMPLPVIQDKFECCRCGACCTNIRTLHQDAKEQRIIFRIPDNEGTGLPLWPWEAERLRKIAEERGIDASIEPLQFFYDKKGKQGVIVSYHLNSNSCPFYKPGECTVYGQRPHVCRMFPLISSGIFEFRFGRQPRFARTVCNSDSGAGCYEAGNAKDFAGRMRQYYDDSFIVAVQNDIINYFIASKIKELTQEGVIDPVIAPRELALGRFEKSGKISFMQLLEENGENAEELAETFKSLRDAESLVGSLTS
ncbi:MAG: YkgJ family cysteine cluster protein [Candidatus Aenigmarchaeota archaeon]|nr:YkgJ family cysteine cluster protein [Candidatus Aenigmarchaeota archaeon]